MEGRERYRISEVLRGYLALWAARKWGRSGHPTAEQAEAGRLGGAAGAAVMSRPGAASGVDAQDLPSAAREASGGLNLDRAPRDLRDEARAEERGEKAADHEVPKGVVQVAKFVFQEFGRDNGTLMAAAVAFYLVLSLIPLVLMAVSVFGFMMGSGRAQTEVLGFLGKFLPGTGGQELVANTIKGAVEARGATGIAGLAGLALTATGGFSTLETAVNTMWHRPNRNFLMNKLVALLMMLVVGVMLALSVGVTTVTALAGKLPALAWLADNGLLQVVGYVLPIMISGLMFSVIFKVYPNGQSRWAPAMKAGFVTAVLWEAFKIGYTFYTQHQGDQSATYGALAGLVGIILWIYYSSALMLLGSELCWVLEGCPGRDAKEAGHIVSGKNER